MIRNNIDLVDKDNWLEKERLRESKVSVWDFDDGRKNREEHAENCDVRDNAEAHYRRHLRREKINYEATGGNEKPLGSVSVWFVMDIILLFVLILISAFFYRISFIHYLALGALFLSINPGLFIWLFGFKKFPPKAYWLTVFIIVVIMEILAIIFTGSRVYYY